MFSPSAGGIISPFSSVIDAFIHLTHIHRSAHRRRSALPRGFFHPDSHLLLLGLAMALLVSTSSGDGLGVLEFWFISIGRTGRERKFDIYSPTEGLFFPLFFSFSSPSTTAPTHGLPRPKIRGVGKWREAYSLGYGIASCGRQ